MSVRPVPGTTNKFDIDVKDGRKGVRIQKRVTCKSQLEALLLEREIKKELGKGTRNPFTVSAIAEKYIPVIETNLSKRSVDEQKRMLYGQILPFFGRYIPIYVSSLLIESYKQKRLKETRRGKIHRQINLELACLSSLVAFGKDNGLCNEYLVTYKPLKYRRPKIQAPTMDVAIKVIEQMSLKHRALYLCLWHAGMRFSEAVKLTWRDVHFSTGYVRVVGKGDKKRLIPMSDLLISTLKEWKEKCKTEIVFPSQRKTHGILTDIRKPLQTAITKAGVDMRITPHMLRHAFASDNIAAGVDPATVQELMGHEDPQTTMIYVHARTWQRKAAIERTYNKRS